MKEKYRPPPTTSLPGLLRDGSDQAFRAVIEGGWRSAQSLNAIMARIASQVDITLPQYYIMMVLAYSEKGLSIGALSKRLRVSQPFITAEIGKLDTAQLVFKRSNPADRRSVLVALTPKGRGVTNRIALSLRDVNDIIYQGMTQKEFSFVEKFIKRLSLRSELALERTETEQWTPGAVARSKKQGRS
jgi:DNA-binding MarR family transcriptional regulator